MARSVYLASVEGNTRKAAVALGVLDAMQQAFGRVAVFRAVTSAHELDYVLEMLVEQAALGLPYADCVGATYDDVHNDPEAALGQIIDRYKAVEAQVDAVLIVGSDYTDVGSPTELAYNARVATNLGAPVIMVLNGRDSTAGEEHLGHAAARTAEDLRQITELALVEIHSASATLLGVIVNRVEETVSAQIAPVLQPVLPEGTPVWTVPEDALLVAPRLSDILHAVGGELILGSPERLTTEALDVVIAAMSMEHILPRLVPGGVVIVPADRSEVLLALMVADASDTFPNLVGIILNGGFDVSEPVLRLIRGFRPTLPVIATSEGSFHTAVTILRTRGRLIASDHDKLTRARALFARSVDAQALVARIRQSTTTVVTPLLFEYALVTQARTAGQHIVLPEGDDDRILQAAHEVLARGIARLTILGDETTVRRRGAELGLHLDGAAVVSPAASPWCEEFAQEYARLRAAKGVTLEQARDRMTDVSYFGTMMVHLGYADGMVSGAAHTTAETIRPAFEIIKTAPGVSTVSSVFLMALKDRVLVYGDCAVVPIPTAAQLADIAVSSAGTARAFGIEPRVAMLSYSTGDSGTGSDVEKVREATQLVREHHPELEVEGPIQYDAAVDDAVAAAKLPDSEVAGRATVFVFPDLNTGNNTYKAVQRSAGAVAMGPILQGLNKPVNDLSRGALVSDIVNTIAITAIQAQHLRGPRAQQLEGSGNS
jgi:phosphate acetyltransferase